jgi:hypothetical protein
MDEIHMKYRMIELEHEVGRLRALLTAADGVKLKLRNVIAHLSAPSNRWFMDSLGEEHRTIAELRHQNESLLHQLNLQSKTLEIMHEQHKPKELPERTREQPHRSCKRKRLE